MSLKDVRLELDSNRVNHRDSVDASNEHQAWAAMRDGAQLTLGRTPASTGAAALRSAEMALARARGKSARTLVQVNARQLASDPRNDPSFVAAARNGGFNLARRT
ncbi:MAG: hypothetical protein ACAI38_10080 [Myxococcota bacterium]